MENESQIRVRLGTIDDVNELVKLHFKCFKRGEHLAMILGESFMREVFNWFVTSRRTITIVAEHLGEDWKIIGFNTACNGPYHRLMFSQNKVAAIKCFLTRPWVVLSPAVLRWMSHAFFDSDPLERKLNEDINIAHWGMIGIDPKHRQRGVAHRVVERTLEECLKRGWTRMRVVTYKKNRAARNTLVRFGFKELPILSEEKAAFGLDLDT